VSTLSPWRRWQIRAIRHLTIQVAAFGIGIAIAVVCAIDGNWIAAGVGAFILFIGSVPGAVTAHNKTLRHQNAMALPFSLRRK